MSPISTIGSYSVSSTYNSMRQVGTTHLPAARPQSSFSVRSVYDLLVVPVAFFMRTCAEVHRDASRHPPRNQSRAIPHKRGATPRSTGLCSLKSSYPDATRRPSRGKAHFHRKRGGAENIHKQAADWVLDHALWAAPRACMSTPRCIYR